MLWPLSDFLPANRTAFPGEPTDWYQGQCPVTGQWHRLPRTPLAEAVAQGLMRQLADDPVWSQAGKMYGVLLVTDEAGHPAVLKAFSGELQGVRQVPGWVPPIPGREQVGFAEAATLNELNRIQARLLQLHQMPERKQYATLAQQYAAQLEAMGQRHRERKGVRSQKRQSLQVMLTGEALAIALTQLDDESRRDGLERRHLKQQRDQALAPLKQTLTEADAEIAVLKQQRQTLSRQLQTQMHAVYSLTNFAGESRSIDQLAGGGNLPTGTGDCCAPKLLHYAATHHLKPIAMAEFWWGPSDAAAKQPGTFYGACIERCQPIMGFLLAGLPAVPDAIGGNEPLPILYQDDWLIAIDKPAGLLSVPGRYLNGQASALRHLQPQLPDAATLLPVHRLDQDTSGILLFARDEDTHRQLSQQFQQRQVQKEYGAILSQPPNRESGEIDLPLYADPTQRPRQIVDWQRGKPSLTRFRVLSQTGSRTRVLLIPITGRTHQLRVHAAHPAGLGAPILGDRLYGMGTGEPRLHLHAQRLVFEHPRLGERIVLEASSPF